VFPDGRTPVRATGNTKIREKLVHFYVSNNLRLAVAGGAAIVEPMSPRDDKGPTAWQRVRALFELTPQERLLVFGLLTAALVGLGVRAWILYNQRAVPYRPAGVMEQAQNKR